MSEQQTKNSTAKTPVKSEQTTTPSNPYLFYAVGVLGISGILTISGVITDYNYIVTTIGLLGSIALLWQGHKAQQNRLQEIALIAHEAIKKTNRLQQDAEEEIAMLKATAVAVVPQNEIDKAIEEEISDILSAAAGGDFGKSIIIQGKTGFALSLAEGINQLCDVSQKSLDEVRRCLDALASGDLSVSMQGTYMGVFGDIQQALNGTTDKLQSLISSIKDSSSTVSLSSQEIASGTNDLAKRTELQAATIQETASSSRNITDIVQKNAKNASDARELAHKASHQATKGSEVVHKAVKAMQGISQSSQKVVEIIGLIDDIAFQTNLLALNAAVEAARAGEAGKGFAVVASEVRALAGRSADASKEIKQLIQNSVEQVKSGSALVHNSGEALEAIEVSVQEVSNLIAEIAKSSERQTKDINEIDKAINELDDSTQQNAAMVEENTAAAQNMADEARRLQDVIEQFKSGNISAARTSMTAIKSEAAKQNFVEEKSVPAKQVVNGSAPTSSNTTPKSIDDGGWEIF